MKIVLVAVAGGVLGVGVLWLLLGSQSAAPPSPPASTTPAPSVRTVVQTVIVERAPSSPTKPAQAAPTLAQTGVAYLEKAAIDRTGLVAAQTSRVAASALRTGVVNVAIPVYVGAESELSTSLPGSFGNLATHPSTEGVAQVFDSLAPVVGNVSPQAIEALVGLKKLRGANATEQKKIFADTSLKLVEQSLNAIGSVLPVAPLLSSGLDALAQTGTGKQVLRQVGRSEEQVYDAQKILVNTGDLSGAVASLGGGSSHQERESKFFGAVMQTVKRLEQGGTLDQAALNGFNQSVDYGFVFVEGYDLRAIVKSKDFKLGGNPFKKASAPSAAPFDPGAAERAAAQATTRAQNAAFDALPLAQKEVFWAQQREVAKRQEAQAAASAAAAKKAQDDFRAAQLAALPPWLRAELEQQRAAQLATSGSSAARSNGLWSNGLYGV